MGGRVPDLGRRMWSCPRGHKQQSAPLLFQISLSELNGDLKFGGRGERLTKGWGQWAPPPPHICTPCTAPGEGFTATARFGVKAH